MIRIIQQAKRVTDKYIRVLLILGQSIDKQIRWVSSEDNVIITKILIMLHNLKVTKLKAEAADRISDWLRN